MSEFIKKRKKNFIIWVLIMTFLFAMSLLMDGTNYGNKSSLSNLISMIETNQINKAQVFETTFVGVSKNDEKVVANFPESYSPKLLELLQSHNVEFEFIPADKSGGIFGRIMGLLGFVLSWLPIILILWIWYRSFKPTDKNKDSNSQSGGGFFGNHFGFSKSKATKVDPDKLGVTFKDVAGIDEAKDDLENLVDFLKNTSKYAKLGGKLPRGCLLDGPPGTGKTLLAKAVAAEAGVPFFSISGSDFIEMFVGVGASRVRDLFDQAKKNAPCIIFIDEIDAVGRHRGSGTGGGNDEREQTLNQLLVEMDGFDSNIGVIVLAATNRADVLDSALKRPGRFDRTISISLPDIKGREEILKIHAGKVSLSSNVDLNVIARGTPGFSGADLANLVNESALYAAKNNKNCVTMDDFEYAKDKIMMGSERKTLIMSEEERRLTAYHEAGHALVAHSLPDSDPIHKATIMPRGRSLGMVMRLPSDDRTSYRLNKMMTDLAVAAAGREAERIIFGEQKVTSGASSDISMATNLATAMITEWGMSEELGFINYNQSKHDGYNHLLSDLIKKKINDEIKRVVQESCQKANHIISSNIEVLHNIAKYLMELETINGEEIAEIVSTGKLVRIK
jgi:cell division protease FtsH